MKVLYVLTGLLSAVIASPLAEVHPLVRRDQVSVIETALYNSSNQTNNLNNLLNTFTITDVFSLQALTQNVLGAIYAGNAAVEPIAPITTDDALALTPVIEQLAGVVNKTIANTIAHREAFGGLAPVVLYSLQQQQNATIAFALTVSGKLPSSLVSASAALNAPILNALSAGIAAFNTTPVNTDQTVYSSDASASVVSRWVALCVASLVAMDLLL